MIAAEEEKPRHPGATHPQANYPGRHTCYFPAFNNGVEAYPGQPGVVPREGILGWLAGIEINLLEPLGM